MRKRGPDYRLFFSGVRFTFRLLLIVETRQTVAFFLMLCGFLQYITTSFIYNRTQMSRSIAWCEQTVLTNVPMCNSDRKLIIHNLQCLLNDQQLLLWGFSQVLGVGRVLWPWSKVDMVCMTLTLSLLANKRRDKTIRYAHAVE